MTDKNDVVIINLDRPRQLWFGHKALKTLGSMTGKDIDALDFNNLDLDDLEKIMYCGLLKDARENNETIKLEQMEDLLDMAPFGEIIEKMHLAFQAAFSTHGEESEKNLKRVALEAQKKKGNGPGKNR